MFQKYKYVLTVYKERSFTNAAKRLFISQPSLSVAIQNIEKQLGAPLFERNNSAIKPTEIGLAYIATAEKIHCAEEEFKRRLTEINGLQTGKLVVGGSNYLSSDVLPQVISRFRARFPGVEIVLTEANSTYLRQMLLREEVDLVIDNFDDTEHYELFPLTKEQILLCIPTTSGIQYNGTDQLDYMDIIHFADKPFVLLKSENDMYRRAMDSFDGNGIVPNVVFSVDQLNIAYALTESGLGACFLPDTFFKYRKRMANIALYKIKHKSAERTLYVGYKKGRYCTHAMAEFIRITREMIGD